METYLKIGDKVSLIDADDFVLPKVDESKMTEKEKGEYANKNKDAIQKIREGKNHYVVLEITATHIHCRNEAIPRWMAKRNMFYGQNDLHLIVKK